MFDGAFVFCLRELPLLLKKGDFTNTKVEVPVSVSL